VSARKDMACCLPRGRKNVSRGKTRKLREQKKNPDMNPSCRIKLKSWESGKAGPAQNFRTACHHKRHFKGKERAQRKKKNESLCMRAQYPLENSLKGKKTLKNMHDTLPRNVFQEDEGKKKLDGLCPRISVKVPKTVGTKRYQVRKDCPQTWQREAPHIELPRVLLRVGKQSH